MQANKLSADLENALLSRWFVIHHRTGEIRPCLTMEELAQRDHGEWRSWLKVAHASSDGIKFDEHILVAPVNVSTVFLGLDHGWGFGPTPQPPVLFETMIFGGRLDQEQWRYCTKEQAIQGHRRAVAMAKLARLIGGRLAKKIVEYCWRNTVGETY